ncbi:recombinase family protein [Psychrobacillus sp. PGGUH221]|uniref:recombinase family protein n=1 Tax=Psychrobacillus sp. PGGUH221 TaxID=3020058 RepID=UPI0035C76A7E
MTSEITTGTTYGYARVSIVQQDLGLQVEALTKAGVDPKNIYSEKMSGKDAKNRTEWNRLKDRLVTGDLVVVHKLDRLGRSMVDVMSIVEYFKGIAGNIKRKTALNKRI